MVQMANNDYPALDGVAPSWADIIVKASPAGAPLIEMKDIKGINTGITLDIGVQKAGGRVKKRTTGDLGQEASLVLYREGWLKLQRGLMAVAPTRGNQVIIGVVHFGVQIQHTPPGSTEIFDLRLKGCRIAGRTFNSAEGPDAEEVEVPLSVIEIVEMIDGKEVVIL